MQIKTIYQPEQNNITALSMCDVPTANCTQSAVYKLSHQVYKKDDG